jgi:hypothetical protein
VHRAHRTVRGERDLPQHGRPNLVGQQARRCLAEHRWVQRDAHIGEVQGGPAPVRLEIERPAGADERGDVRDRVMDEMTVAVSGDVHGLIEVTAAGRIERDQRDVGGVVVGQLDVSRAALGLGTDVRREIAGHLQLGPHCGEVQRCTGDSVLHSVRCRS